MSSGNFRGKLSQHSTSAPRQEQPGALEEHWRSNQEAVVVGAQGAQDERAGVRGEVRWGRADLEGTVHHC